MENAQSCFGWMEQSSGLNFSTFSSTVISLLWKTGLYYVTARLPNTSAGSGQPSMHHWHQNLMRFDPEKGFERTSCFSSIFTNWTCLKRGRKKKRYRVLFDKWGKTVVFSPKFSLFIGLTAIAQNKSFLFTVFIISANLVWWIEGAGGQVSMFSLHGGFLTAYLTISCA